MGTLDQSLTPGRTTLLEGVNTMLEAIGEMPVNSLEGQTAMEPLMAMRTLLEIHKEGQTRGWGWNTDDCFPFPVNSQGELDLPANVVRWIPQSVHDRRLQQRGQRVWDAVKKSYQLAPEIEEVMAQVVWLLSWDESPEQFNRWAITRAARVFGARVLGNDSLVGFTLKDEQDAMAELQRMDTENEGYSMLTEPIGRQFGSYRPLRGLMRRGIGGGVIPYG